MQKYLQIKHYYKVIFQIKINIMVQTKFFYLFSFEVTIFSIEIA